MKKLSMEEARRLCLEVQSQQVVKLFTQCWGCITFSKGDPAKMCGGVVECNLVLKYYQRQNKQSDSS